MAAQLAPTEDKHAAEFLTQFHKSLRSMIYSVGGKLQTTDFSNREESALMFDELISEFSSAHSAQCILCFIHAHAGAEDANLFPRVDDSDHKLVSDLMEDHGNFAKELEIISKMIDDLKAENSSSKRISSGKKLSHSINDFLARYLAHMNREEAELVPLMDRVLTVDQILSVRNSMAGHLERDRFPSFMKWQLAALNLPELIDYFMEIKRSFPERLGAMYELARTTVDKERLAVAREKVGT